MACAVEAAQGVESQLGVLVGLVLASPFNVFGQGDQRLVAPALADGRALELWRIGVGFGRVNQAMFSREGDKLPAFTKGRCRRLLGLRVGGG